MSWILGNTDRLMDARFAAAAGAERLLLRMAEDKQAWNEIGGWVAGPELWLIASRTTIELGPTGLSSYVDCWGCFVQDAEVWDRISSNLDWTNRVDTAWALGLNPEVLQRMRQSLPEGRHHPDWVTLDSRVLDSEDTKFLMTAFVGRPTAWYMGIALDQEPAGLEESTLVRWLEQGEELTGLPCSGLCFEAQAGQDSDYVTIQDYLDTVGGRWL